jgi:hypothetical protein
MSTSYSYTPNRNSCTMRKSKVLTNSTFIQTENKTYIVTRSKREENLNEIKEVQAPESYKLTNINLQIQAPESCKYKKLAK